MKRWPLIRHVRFFWAAWRLARWWKTVGSHYWLAPNPLDERYLEAIWKGKA